MIVIAGGGAAGFFAAIAAAESNPRAGVMLLEKTARPLAKVGISGGGRCNVTHDCFDPRALATRYPRGGRALIGPLTRFGPAETVAWFESRGVRLKTESDGRMFPVTDSSQTIIACLERAAQKAGVHVSIGTGLRSARQREQGGFTLELTNGTILDCERLLWAGGGCKPEAHPAVALGHTLVPPVPSLFTFHIDEPWVRALSGLSVSDVEVAVPGEKLKERGPVLFTHAGLSGPAILRLSAWGARVLHARNYRFPLLLNWLPGTTPQAILTEIQDRRVSQGAKTLLRSVWHPLPARLWERLLEQAEIPPGTRWSAFPSHQARALARVLTATPLAACGKSMNKEEFVTCGGIPLTEVDFKTMQSRIVPGLYFAGEALDIDGVTGGFNFQAAWTTGWIAGRAVAASLTAGDIDSPAQAWAGLERAGRLPCG